MLGPGCMPLISWGWGTELCSVYPHIHIALSISLHSPDGMRPGPYRSWPNTYRVLAIGAGNSWHTVGGKLAGTALLAQVLLALPLQLPRSRRPCISGGRATAMSGVLPCAASITTSATALGSDRLVLGAFLALLFIPRPLHWWNTSLGPQSYKIYDDLQANHIGMSGMCCTLQYLLTMDVGCTLHYLLTVKSAWQPHLAKKSCFLPWALVSPWIEVRLALGAS